jgi:hypothetical protein
MPIGHQCPRRTPTRVDSCSGYAAAAGERTVSPAALGVPALGLGILPLTTQIFCADEA